MRWGYRPYVSVAKRREQALKKMAKLRKKGMQIFPVATAGGRKIATTFWGKSWCNHIESFSDYDNRLPRGRTYVRNGSVCHLEINEQQVKAIVSGGALYNVTITINPIDNTKWQAIKKTCQGKVHSVLDLLSGKLSEGVMDVVCHQTDGLFPLAKEIKLACDCPDWATMCKHVAAVLYGVGTRLDSEPKELFKLRAVDYEEMIDISQAVADITTEPKGKGKRLSASDVANIFDFEINIEAPKKPIVKTRISSVNNNQPIPKVITGFAISKYRKTLGLNKTACAEKIGVSISSLTKWEAFGRKKVSVAPRSLEKLHRLWRA